MEIKKLLTYLLTHPSTIVGRKYPLLGFKPSGMPTQKLQCAHVPQQE